MIETLAARFHGVGDLRLETVELPDPGPSDVVIEPTAVGLCGTDTHILDGHFPAEPPIILGHEIAGTVVETGSAVSGVDVGDLITVEPHRYCGECTHCRLGAEHMCLAKRGYGVRLNGGLAHRLVVPGRVAYRLPPGIDAATGAFAEPVACCVHGMDRLAPKSGLPLAIFGVGPAGAILTALAKLAGAHPVVAIEPRAHRRDLATRVGADIVLDPVKVDIAEATAEITGGLGFPYLIDAVGSAAIVESAVGLAARAGSVLVFGVAPPGQSAAIEPERIYAKELTIIGAAINPYTHARAVGLLPRLPLAEFDIAAFPLESVHEAMATARAGTADKVQVRRQRVSIDRAPAREGRSERGADPRWQVRR